jgi:hypothetical protein
VPVFTLLVPAAEHVSKAATAADGSASGRPAPLPTAGSEEQDALLEVTNLLQSPHMPRADAGCGELPSLFGHKLRLQLMWCCGQVIHVHQIAVQRQCQPMAVQGPWVLTTTGLDGCADTNDQHDMHFMLLPAWHACRTLVGVGQVCAERCFGA